MSTVVGLFHKYSSATATEELCAKLTPLLEEDNGPKELKCTKRVYTAFIKNLDMVLAKAQYESIVTLFKSLSYMAKGSNDPSTGFHKFISWGLSEKILSWCVALFGQASTSKCWGEMMDDVLFNLTVILGHLTEEDQQEMVPLLTPLLDCVTNNTLPCSAKIEAARGSNILLEACTAEYKTAMTRRSKAKQLIMAMGKSIEGAGNFELQVSIVECLYRMTTASERSSLAQKWFEGAPSSVLRRFTSIREEEFEVDCRLFLNELNSSAQERTVFSLSCMRMFCGGFELHCPEDESLGSFWVDFNTGSSSVAVYVNDPAQSSMTPEEGVWEMVTIKQPNVIQWTVKVVGGEFLLTISLRDHAHTLLPSLPSSQSHEVTIHFNSVCDPTHPTRLVFGASKQPNTSRQPEDKLTKQSSALQSTKQSSALQSVYINHRVHAKSGLQEISPIEAPPDMPAVGEHVNSQGATTPTRQGPAPMDTPATSTPKPRRMKQPITRATTPARKNSHTTPSSSARSTRPPLSFVSSGSSVGVSRRESLKSSLAMNTVVLGSGKSRIVQTDEARERAKSKTLRTRADEKLYKKPEVISADPANLDEGQGKQRKQLSSGRAQKQASELKTPTGWNQTNKTGRKCLSQLANFKCLQSPEDTSSPVLDYDKPSAALQDKLQSQENEPKSLTTSAPNRETNEAYSETESVDSDPYRLPQDKQHSGRVSHNSSLNSVLSNLSNKSSGGRKQRVFNLSGASLPRTRRGKNRKSSASKVLSRGSSLNSTLVSDTEPFAIPDSLPTGLSPSGPKPLSKNTAAKTRRKPRRVNIPRKKDSYDFESDGELDQSWEPVKRTTERVVRQKEKINDHLTKPAKKQADKTSKCVGSSANNSERATRKTARGKGAADKSANDAKLSKQLPTRRGRQQTIDEMYDLSSPCLEVPSRQVRKRMIDDVYGFTTPDSEGPKAKLTKCASKAPKNKTKNKSHDSTSQAKPSSSNLKPPQKPRQNKPLETAASKLKLASVKKGADSVDLKTKKSSSRAKHLTTDSESGVREANKNKNKSTLSRKRSVTDCSDFDDLVLSLQSKKHCPEQERQLSQRSRHIQSPNKTRSPEEQVEEADPSYSPGGVSCSNSDVLSVKETVKDKVLDTQKTEEATVPSSKHDPPPSPSVSLHSSQITADLNITAGFEELCRSLIFKSGAKQTMNSHTTSDKYKTDSKTSRQEELESDEDCSEGSVECENVGQPESNQENITLTQLTRNIVHSHHQLDSQKAGTRRVGKNLPKATKAPPEKQRKAKMTSKVATRQKTATDYPLESDQADSETRSYNDNESVSTCSHPNTKDSIDPQDTSTSSMAADKEQRLIDNSSDMRELETMFNTKLQKVKNVKGKRINSKNNPGELLQLWTDQQRVREETLAVYQKQLFRELEVLEKDAQQTHDTEKQTVHLLTKRLRSLKQSIGLQQKQVDRVRTLQVTFYQHLSQLEKTQSNEQLGARKSLKQEMHSLQKKLLVDYERQEVSRIKQSLHAMLLQVL